MQTLFALRAVLQAPLAPATFVSCSSDLMTTLASSTIQGLLFYYSQGKFSHSCARSASARQRFADRFARHSTWRPGASTPKLCYPSTRCCPLLATATDVRQSRLLVAARRVLRPLAGECPPTGHPALRFPGHSHQSYTSEHCQVLKVKPLFSRSA